MRTPASTFELPASAAASASKPWWLWPNLLSLDAPLISLLWQSLASKDTGITLSFASRLALPLSVWVIYLADRLMDSIRLDGSCQTARHCFYREHRVAGLVLLATVSFVLAVTLRFLPPDVLRNGLVVSALVGVYMLVVHALPFLRSYLPKEVAVAVLFSAGTTLAVWTRLPNPFTMAVPVLLFAFICWLNCCAIQVWESRGGNRPMPPGEPQSWLVQRLVPVSLSVFCISAALLPFTSCHVLLLAVAICSLADCWLSRMQSSLDLDALRVFADLPLVLPILLLIR